MSDRPATVCVSAKRITDFKKQVEAQTAMHILADAILPSRAAQLAADVMIAAIIQDGVGVAVRREFPQTAREWVNGGAQQ